MYVNLFFLFKENRCALLLYRPPFPLSYNDKWDFPKCLMHPKIETSTMHPVTNISQWQTSKSLVDDPWVQPETDVRRWIFGSENKLTEGLTCCLPP
ncbi:hypothetical protein RRG08_001391 [Elysia crispata]|uniref:Uncharacterized protein n=1 Tax=Elysia crispata TaxID=231223 RepID=A0AAE0ZRG7_9GAST|nr:hypothetical protein RRG08_001391 [Elysia crispata]